MSAAPAAGFARLTAAAVGVTAAAGLPLFLLGALAVAFGDELGVGAADVGAAVALFFLTSVLAGPLVIGVIERLGARSGALLTCLASAAALTAIALVVTSRAGLFAAMALAGFGQAFGQPSANGLLSRGLTADREGTAFGLKQSAVPLSTLLAGATVPLLALTVGWRAAYALTAVLVLAVPVLVPPTPRAPGRGAGRSARGSISPRLLWLAAGGVCAAAPTMALGSFLVATAVGHGIAVGTAGWLLVAGSVAAILIRLALGVAVDAAAPRRVEPLQVMPLMMAAGAVGVALLGVAAGPVAFTVATLAAFGLGWAWNGLMDVAVVRLNRDAPASATSVFLTAFFLGAAVGPLAFGATVEAAGFAVAWAGAGALLAAAAGCVTLARFSAATPRPRPDRRRRRPVGERGTDGGGRAGPR